MIFPAVRISELRADAEKKNAAFSVSRQRLQRAVRKKMNPLTFLKDHPKLILGVLVSLFSATRGAQKLLGKGTFLRKVIKAEWALGALRLGGKFALKAGVPIMASTFKFAMKGLRKSFLNGKAT